MNVAVPSKNNNLNFGFWYDKGKDGKKYGKRRKMEQDKDGIFYEKDNFTNVGENSGKKEKAGI